MNSIEVTNSPPIKDENYEKTASLLKVIAASQTPNDSGEDKHTIVRAILPCPFTRHKMFCPNPIFFEAVQKFDCIYCLFKNFCAGTKRNFTECKSSFCLAQNVCDCHNI